VEEVTSIMLSQQGFCFFVFFTFNLNTASMTNKDNEERG